MVRSEIFDKVKNVIVRMDLPIGAKAILIEFVKNSIYTNIEELIEGLKELDKKVTEEISDAVDKLEQELKDAVDELNSTIETTKDDLEKEIADAKDSAIEESETYTDGKISDVNNSIIKLSDATIYYDEY